MRTLDGTETVKIDSGCQSNTMIKMGRQGPAQEGIVGAGRPVHQGGGGHPPEAEPAAEGAAAGVSGGVKLILLRAAGNATPTRRGAV